MNDELVEDDELTLPGESLQDQATSVDCLPVRQLKDFTIYEMVTNCVIHVGELTALSMDIPGRISFGASGIATAWTDDDQDNDDDDSDVDYSEDHVPNTGERIKLSKILAFNVHHHSQEAKTLDRFVGLQHVDKSELGLISV